MPDPRGLEAERQPGDRLRPAPQLDELLTDAVEPDDDATACHDFADLVRAMTPELLTYCAQRVDDHLAQDVVASTFEVTWRRWTSLPPDDSGRRAWVYETTKRMIHAERRRHTRRAGLITKLGPMARGSAPPSADEVVVREHVEHTLGGLPPEQAAVVRCVVLQDLDAQQTAEHLGISLTAVTSRLNRARPALRQLLAVGREDDHDA